MGHFFHYVILGFIVPRWWLYYIVRVPTPVRRNKGQKGAEGKAKQGIWPLRSPQSCCAF